MVCFLPGIPAPCFPLVMMPNSSFRLQLPNAPSWSHGLTSLLYVASAPSWLDSHPLSRLSGSNLLFCVIIILYLAVFPLNETCMCQHQHRAWYGGYLIKQCHRTSQLLKWNGEGCDMFVTPGPSSYCVYHLWLSWPTWVLICFVTVSFFHCWIYCVSLKLFLSSSNCLDLLNIVPYLEVLVPSSHFRAKSMGGAWIWNMEKQAHVLACFPFFWLPP